MIRAALAAALALAAIGCHPDAGPRPRCADAWKDVPAAERTYDFAGDAKRTARGNEGYARFAERLPRARCAKPWTVLVYLAADADDLAAPALRDLRSIEDAPAGAGSTEQADVIAELDRAPPAEALRLHLFHAPAGEGIRSPIVEARKPDDAAPEQLLSRFVAWGMDRYPADHYAVIVWGHGLGYRPAEAGRGAPVRYDPAGTSGGIAFRTSRGTVLDTPGLARAIAPRGAPIDLYASDACLMESVEVAADLAGAARFVIGSEQVEEDYLGLPYATWIPLLNGSAALPASPRCTPADVACDAAAALPSLQREAAARADPKALGFTLSTLDEAKVTGALVPALRGLGAALDAYLKEDDLRRINIQLLLGADRGPTKGTPGFRGGARDVGVFLARLRGALDRQAETGAARGALLDAVRSAEDALRAAVIAASFGSRYEAAGFEGMAGVSVWLPHDADEHRGRASFFAPSALDRESPRFRGFLDRLFAPNPR